MSTTLPGLELRGAPALSRTATRGLGVEARIDLCRGLFAVLVVVAHALEVTAAIHPASASEMPEASAPLVLHTIGTGFYWVMGFFVISGYCIHLSAERLSREGQFPLGRYTAARLTRILPLYYVALLFSVVAEVMVRGTPYRPTNWANGIDAWTFLMQIVGVQNLTQTFGSFAPSWSITNELFYYVLYGLLAWGFSARGARAAWVGMAGCVIIGGAMLALYLKLPGRGVILGLGLLFGLGANWFLGALVAAYRDRLRVPCLVTKLARAWPLVFAAAVAARYGGRVRLEWVYLGCGLAFSLLLIRFLASEGTSGQTSAKTPELIRVFGLASYPIYLFHGPVMMLVGSLLNRFQLPLEWRSTWVVLSIVPIAVGLFLGLALEAPILAVRARWLSSRKEAAR